MNMPTNRLAGLLLLGAAFLASQSCWPPPTAPVQPQKPVAPAPPPEPPPCPPNRPWGVGSPSAVADDDPSVDLLAVPKSARPRNVGGRDGAGLCVFTSIQYSAWWQNESRLKDFQAKMRSEPGGGYPEKVTAMIRKYGAGTQYIQYQGRDPSIIELALKTGRLPAVTWGGNHMLTCVHLDASRAAIVDNNSPDRVQWMSRSQFLQKWTQGGGGWVVILLNPPPPPPPRGQAIQSTGRSREPAGVARSVISPEIPRGIIEWRPPETDVWELNGKRVTAHEAISATLEDDSAKLHLTVIGASDRRQPVLAGLGELRTRYLIQEYDPNSWEISCGFVTGGQPTVYLQDRSGRVLLRADGPQDVAWLISALRRADPSYQPAQDPTGKPSLQLPFDLKNVSWPVVGLVVVGVVLLLRKDK